MNENKLYEARLTCNHYKRSNCRHEVHGSEINRPTSLEIIKVSGRDYIVCYLYYLDRQGNQMTDTVFDCLEDTFRQAKIEFGIKRKDWQEASKAYE